MALAAPPMMWVVEVHDKRGYLFREIHIGRDAHKVAHQAEKKYRDKGLIVYSWEL